MSEPILDTDYWRRRLEDASSNPINLHQSVFRCSIEQWRKICAKHVSILWRHLRGRPRASILDCGCGYGRLLDMLPLEWDGVYLGIDISPSFIEKARSLHQGRELTRDCVFEVGDLRDLSGMCVMERGPTWDFAVLISIRPMVRRNLGEAVWQQMEEQIRGRAKRLLYLEYDPDDNGSLE